MLIINVHDLDPQPSSDWAFQPSRLQALLERLVSRGYTFGLPTAVSPDTDLFCSITFDDCRLGAYRYGPEILASFSVVATYFPVIRFLLQEPPPEFEAYSRFMGVSELRALFRAGHAVGSHGMSHAPYFHQFDADIASDLTQSKRALEELLASTIQSVSIPYGQINSRTLELAASAGYSTVLSADAAWNKRFLPLPALRRISLRSSISDEALYAALDEMELRRSVVQAVDCSQNAVTAWEWPTLYRLRSYDVVVVTDQKAKEHCERFGVCNVIVKRSADVEADVRAFLDQALNTQGRDIYLESFSG
ncbi:MAG: polysaccharide deacetylase family protein [Bdellovibrionota bacterium]